MTQIGGYCPHCGATGQAGQNYCVRCGAALGTSCAAGSPGARIGGERGYGSDVPYSREAKIGAVLLTIFMPFIALIAALMLRAQELRPARRDQLKSWAIASGAWLATGWVIAIIAFASALSAVNPSSCKGGIDQTVPPSYESSDGTHWVGTFTCMNGGTITKPVPASQVPGGG